MALEFTKFEIQNYFRYIELTEDDKEKLKLQRNWKIEKQVCYT